MRSSPRSTTARNKTFFFVDYEGYRRNSVNTINTTRSHPGHAQRRFLRASANAIFDPLTTTHCRERACHATSLPATAFRRAVRPGHREAHERLSGAADQRRSVEQLPGQPDLRRRTGTRATCASITSSRPTIISSPAGRFNTPRRAPNTFPAVQIPGFASRSARQRGLLRRDRRSNPCSMRRQLRAR